jgi:hypothetical protein
MSKPVHALDICDGGIELDQPGTATARAAPPKLDDWQSRRRTRQLGRELRRPASPLSAPFIRATETKRRFDPPDDVCGETPVDVTPTVASEPRRSASRQVLAWLVVALGALALCGGLVLVAWSISSGRREFWELALGLTLGGQGTLILGLLLVVSRLWRTSRTAAMKLQDVHLRLGQLQRTAEALSANRGGAPAFYADLARGAPPQILLANLKGQLDQLATRIGVR